MVSSASPVPEEDGPERGAVRQATDARGSAASSAAAAGSSTRKPAARKPAAQRKPAARKAPARKPAKTAASAAAPTTAAPRKVDPELYQTPTVRDAAAEEIAAKREAKASKAAEAKAAAAARAQARAEAKARIAAEKKAKAEAQAAADAAAKDKAEAQAKIDAENRAKAEAEAEARTAAAAAAQAQTARQAQAEAAAREAELEAALETRPRASARQVDTDRVTVIEHAKDTALTFAHPVAPDPRTSQVVLSIQRLRKTFGAKLAVDNVSLDVRAGSFYGIVGPNGAGKTTTLSIVTGMLRPDSGAVFVHGVDVWRDPAKAKRSIGVLPDRLRLFDRLTGAQLLYYAGTLRGLDSRTVKDRAEDLAVAFGFQDALGRLVADYSAGMTKKVALAAAMIHSPRLLVLDEPFESVDPVSAATVIEILQKYVAAGGTVVLSSHGMDFIQRVCDSVAIIVHGNVLAAGPVDEVRSGDTLENRFVELAGGRKAAEGMEWLHSFSD